MANFDELAQLHLIELLEEEEMQRENRAVRNARRQPDDPFKILSDKHFIKYFRLTKHLTRLLINDLTPHLSLGIRHNCITIDTKVK